MTQTEALRLALEALEPIPYKDDWTVAKETNKAIIAIKEALAQPEQDWIGRERAVGYREGHRAALAQRTWVGLKDKEIEEIWNIAMFTDYGIGAELSNQPFIHYARAIEAKLKEHNE